MRNAWLSFAVVFLGCSNDNFNGQDGGDAMTTDSPVGMIEGGAEDSPADNYVPPPIHRLFAGNRSNTTAKPIVVWDNCDKLMGDRAPDVELVAGQFRTDAITIAKDRLYTWDSTAHVLTGIDNVGSISSSTVVSIGLGANAFLGNGMPDVGALVYSKTNDLLFATNPYTMGPGIQMFAAASTMPNGTKAKAQFGGTGQPLNAVALDPGNQLYAADSQQSVIHYMAMATAKTGQVTFTSDFAPSPQMLILELITDATRLYAIGRVVNGSASVFIYNLAGIHPGSSPDVTLNSSNGLPNPGVCLGGALVNDVLVVGCNDSVHSFANAKSVTGAAQGINLTSDTIVADKMTISAKTGLLYTSATYKGNAGIQVWKDPTGSPMLQAELRTGLSSVSGVVLYEP